MILLKIDGVRAMKEASFYVEMSRHPHIVRTYGMVYEEKDDADDESDESCMLLQEYATLGTLGDLIEEHGKPLREEVLNEIFIQICDAMSFLAYNHIVHGDLACRNVLVFRFDERNPRNIIVKLTDFGLSRCSKLYALMGASTRTMLNIIPVRYAAPEILSKAVKPEDYTVKSDVYSMGVLMWEAYSRGRLPWAKISDDNEVIQRINNGELLPKPSNCTDTNWSIMCQTWSKHPTSRPSFIELKRLLSGNQPTTSSLLESLTVQLSDFDNEFQLVKGQFINGCPKDFQSDLSVKKIYKIKNELLNSRYRRFCEEHSDATNEEVIAWHGTSAKCHDTKCMSKECAICQIARGGFRKHCARQNTSSYRCWGAATYFACQSFVCHSYNGASKLNRTETDRCMIMAKINYGRRFDYRKFQASASRDWKVYRTQRKDSVLDTMCIPRDYYVSPAEYILLYDNAAALPMYIVVYTLKDDSREVRSARGKFCEFHKTHHRCNDDCDGHYNMDCLGVNIKRINSEH